MLLRLEDPMVLLVSILTYYRNLLTTSYETKYIIANSALTTHGKSSLPTWRVINRVGDYCDGTSSVSWVPFCTLQIATPNTNPGKTACQLKARNPSHLATPRIESIEPPKVADVEELQQQHLLPQVIWKEIKNIANKKHRS
ncbi:hypothetical protein TNCV_246141 [Trichonephila clavipes]|nr:hypothetical protein TNCV_246141 [Trichonephila clavipes]